MLPLSPELVAAHSTSDSQRDAAIQAIAYTLAPAHRLADKAANIEVRRGCLAISRLAGLCECIHASAPVL